MNDTHEEQASVAFGQEKSPAPKKKRKVLVGVGVVAAVLVVAAVGFGVWHAQPSFCSAICHSPMDPYVEGYYASDASKLVAAHAESGNACLDCHEPDMQTQVSEAMSWVSGDFCDPLESRADKFGTRDFCLACHDDGDAATGEDWNDIVAATADWGGSTDFNPHSSHLGNAECGTCHSMHGQSQMECAACHYNCEVPEGWTVRESAS